MRDLGLINIDEPFTKLLTQGMVLNHIYSRKSDKGGVEYFWPAEVEDVHDAAGKVTHALLKEAKGALPAGTFITYEGVGTMSKSKNNGVDPQDLIGKYGADTARLYTMFTAPPEATLEWNDAAVEGSYRFLRRVWNFGVKLRAIDAVASHASVAGASRLQEVVFGKETKALRLEVHTVLKQIDYDYQRMQYNTVVSGVMKLLNALEEMAPTLIVSRNALYGPMPESSALRPVPACADRQGAAGLSPEGANFPRGGPSENSSRPSLEGMEVALIEGFGILLRCLYPATPHIAHALWQELGYVLPFGDLLDAPWPRVDDAALVQDEIELMLQVNGKLRGSVRVAAQATREAIEQAALQHEAVQLFVQGVPVKKVVVVPGRLVNVVV